MGLIQEKIAGSAGGQKGRRHRSRVPFSAQRKSGRETIHGFITLRQTDTQNFCVLAMYMQRRDADGEDIGNTY